MADKPKESVLRNYEYGDRIGTYVGELKDNKLAGKYDSNVAEAASSGTWSVTRS